MSKVYVPGANRTAQYWATKFIGSTMNTNCACLHTTEGFTWPAYGGGASAPHLTILPNIKTKTVSMRQHYPANKSSRALVNLSGGVETNTLNVLQIELIGTCDSRNRETWLGRRAGIDYIYWPDAPQWLLDAIAPVFQWLDEQWPNFRAEDATPRGWVQYPASYGINARQRMTFAEWRNAYGIFGHQHVPENAHGDPGDFPIARLVAAIKGESKPPPAPDPTPLPDLEDADPTWLAQLLAAVLEALGKTPTPEPAPKPTPAPEPTTVAVWGKPDTFVLGATGPDVTHLGERIVIWSKALDLPDPYNVGPGPKHGPRDVSGLSAIQVAWGHGDSPADLALGGNSDGYPGPVTFTDLAADPPTPAPDGLLIETISANLAGYDVKGGKANRVHRARTVIPDYLAPKRPDWFHFQECAIDMWPELDQQLPEHIRVPEGGKGRESCYRTDAGIEIIEAKLMNVTHMLAKDTKEFLVIAWECDGYRAVDVNFHSENQGIIVQPLQMRDVLKAAYAMSNKHGVPAANVLATGDANFKGAAAFIRLLHGWNEVFYSAKKTIDLQYHSTNSWRARLTKGRRIDVDATGSGADILEAEQLFGAVISDHWPHRILRRLTR